MVKERRVRDRRVRGVVRIAATLMVSAAAAVLAQGPTAPPAPQPVGVIGSPGGSGPMPAVAEAVASLRTHTLYHPTQLPAEPLPVLLWGNGACADDGLGYAAFLREISSHGFFVVSLGYPRVEPPIQSAAPRAGGPPAPGAVPPGRGRGAAPGNNAAVGAPAAAGAAAAPAATRAGAPAPAAPAAPARPADPTQYTQHLESIAWATKQNADAGAFRGHIDVSRIAVGGHSCGGLQAIAASADPRIQTTMVMNSGVLNGGPSAGLSGIQVTKADLLKVHGPMLYVTGGPSDVAQPNAEDDVKRLAHVPVFWGFDRSGHGGTYRQVNGGTYAQVATAWLRWQLKGDTAAAALFTGADCGLCRDANWTVTRKSIP